MTAGEEGRVEGGGRGWGSSSSRRFESAKQSHQSQRSTEALSCFLLFHTWVSGDKDSESPLHGPSRFSSN